MEARFREQVVASSIKGVRFSVSINESGPSPCVQIGVHHESEEHSFRTYGYLDGKQLRLLVACLEDAETRIKILNTIER